jgi:D-alanyl-D-alanine carboxypeptidase
MRLALTLSFLLFIVSVSAQRYLRLADSIKKLRGVPAIGYAVFTDNGIVDIGVTGYRKYHERDSVRATDRFQLGTNSFQLVSSIAGKMVEAGKIKWTTTFIVLFPEYAKTVRPEFANVDLKMLLSNTAGLLPYKDMEDYVHVPLFNGDLQAQRKAFAVWLLQRPGLSVSRERKMTESIAGYTIAVAMLEKAAASSWENLLDTYINKPLKISVKFGWPNSISADQPWGHWAKYGGLTSEPADTWVKQYPPTLSASGANISLVDYVKFLQQELKGLRGGKTGLTRQTLELIHFGENNSSGFGWQNANSDSIRIAMQTGESYLFSSHVELIPEKNIGIVVVCNDGDSMGKGAVINLSKSLRAAAMNPSVQ